VVPPLKEQMLKAIATLAVVAPLGMAHVTPAPCPQQNSDRVVAFIQLQRVSFNTLKNHQLPGSKKI
jgi:hypothetical protein